MTFTEREGEVILQMKRADYDILIRILQAGCREAWRTDFQVFCLFVAIANEMNTGNPNWVNWETPETPAGYVGYAA